MKKLLTNSVLIAVLMFGMAISCEEEGLTIDVKTDVVGEIPFGTNTTNEGEWSIDESDEFDITEVDEISDVEEIDVKSVSFQVVDLIDEDNNAEGSFTVTVISNGETIIDNEQIFGDSTTKLKLSDFTEMTTFDAASPGWEQKLIDFSRILSNKQSVTVKVTGSVTGLPVEGKLKYFIQVEGTKPLGL